MARHPERPYTLDYIERICDRFIELHGDRFHADDKAIVGGLGEIDGQTVCIIGHQKGRDTASRTYRNFGMANPEGYRKAYRLMEMAEKFGIPVLTLVDTLGAFLGLEAEERGQAEAIARNLKRMAMLKVPIVTIIIGERASGARGIGMGNEVFRWKTLGVLRDFARVLFFHSMETWDYKEQAASAFKLTAPDLLEFGIIDGVIKEPLAGAHRDYDEAAEA